MQVDPVVMATGHTYDRPAIERWLAEGHRTCPVTGVRLRHTELVPNHALRSVIQDWARERGVPLPERGEARSGAAPGGQGEAGQGHGHHHARTPAEAALPEILHVRSWLPAFLCFLGGGGGVGGLAATVVP